MKTINVSNTNKQHTELVEEGEIFNLDTGVEDTFRAIAVKGVDPGLCEGCCLVPIRNKIACQITFGAGSFCGGFIIKKLEDTLEEL